MSYLSVSEVVIHYEEALYISRVRIPLPLTPPDFASLYVFAWPPIAADPAVPDV